MTTALPAIRLLLLAAATSLLLTSCFDHGKKCDPKPSKSPATSANPT